MVVLCIWRRQWHPTPVLLPGKSHGRRSLVGCSPWGREESDTTELLHLHFSLLCIGEGNGNPLQCSCLENPRDGGAWWAAVYGVTQSWTQLKWLSSDIVTEAVEHFFICLFAICISSLVRFLFRCFSLFLIGLFVFLLLKLRVSGYILNNIPLSDMSFEKFSPNLWLASQPLDSIFHRAEIFNFKEVQLVNNFFHRWYLWCCI